MNVLIRSGVLAGAIAILVVAGCSKSETPDEAVQETYSAIQQGNVDAVWKRMSEADRTKFMSALGVSEEEDAKQVLQEEFAKQPYHRIAIDKIQSDGDSATVVATMQRTPEGTSSETTTIKLVKEGGKWVLNDN